MGWDAWVALLAWLVFAPLYLRAAYREMRKQALDDRGARLHGRRREHDDETLANP